MAQVTKTRTYSVGDGLTHTYYNDDRDEIIAGVNSINNSQIASDAAIAISKIANGVDLSTAQTLTNKVISGASNTLTVREADLSLSDNTTNDASTTKHGLLPKLSNSATQFLNGLGAFVTISATVNAYIGTVSRDLTSASGDVSYTGVGFTPKAIIFIGCVNTVTGTATWGVATALAGSVMNDISSLGSPYTDNYQTATWSKVCIRVTTGSGIYQDGAIKSMDADGFTLTWTKSGSPTGTANIIYSNL